MRRILATPSKSIQWLAFGRLRRTKGAQKPSATRQSILAFTSKDMKQNFCSSAWLSEPLTCRSSNKVIAAKYNVTYVLFFHNTIYSGMNNTLHFQQPNCSNIYKSWVPAGGQESCKKIDLKYCVRRKRLHPKFSDDQSGENCMSDLQTDSTVKTMRALSIPFHQIMKETRG